MAFDCTTYFLQLADGELDISRNFICRVTSQLISEPEFARILEQTAKMMISFPMIWDASALSYVPCLGSA